MGLKKENFIKKISVHFKETKTLRELFGEDEINFFCLGSHIYYKLAR